MAQTKQVTRRGTAAARERGGASTGRTGEPRRRELYYSGWFEHIAEHLENRFREFRDVDPLELGPEFEEAICEVLEGFLPARAGVCCGWVVDCHGERRGDDIIVYDASRFPTLRGLRGKKKRVKERVPAEAVLAYLEVKHTLYVKQRTPKKNKGQSLATACRQVEAVKRLRRAPVPLEMITPRYALPKDTIKQRPGFPEIRNPWYAAVWAFNLQVDKDMEHDAAEAVKRCLAAIRGAGTEDSHLPDVIAAGSVMMSPAVVASEGCELRPFITPETNFVFTNGVKALGAAMLHLTWAIDDILLGEIPWRRMLAHQLQRAESEESSVKLAIARGR